MTRRSSRNARRAIANASSGGDPAPSPASSKSARTTGDSGSRRSSGRGRRSRSRSSGGGAAASAASSTRRPAIGKDGKANISCPNCAARYKILEEKLESKVQCTQCHRTFFPLAAANSRRPAPDNSKPVIYGIVAVVAIVVVGMIVRSLSTPAEQTTNTAGAQQQKPRVDLAKTKEVTVVKTWAQAIGDRDRLNTAFNSDLDALQKKFKLNHKKNPYDRSFGDAQKALEKEICEFLFDAPESLVFRAYKPAYARVQNAEMLEDKAGTVELTMAPRDSSVTEETADVLVRYGWDVNAERFKVLDWTVQTMARPDHLMNNLASEKKKGSSKKHTPHKLIPKAEKKSASFGGEKVSVYEAELVPLPHLDSTSAEDRQKIDALITKMIDLNDSGRAFNQASNALEIYGKAAVPRVLNKMYETRIKTDDDVAVLNRLCRFLRHLTGERFGFNPANAAAGSDIGGTNAERVSALKQWYAWWGRYHDRDDWRNIDSDDEVELTTEEIEAKRKAEAEAARKARKERAKRARNK